MNQILIIEDKRYLQHDTGLHHPESPHRLEAISQMLTESDLRRKVIFSEPREATEKEMTRIHHPNLIAQLKQTEGKNQSFLDPDTVTSPHSWKAAKLAAGGLLVGLDQIKEGRVDSVFALPRPPGHHAEANQAMGFCLLNNIAIAAQYALDQKMAKRVLIFDFDVHHGNGTQHIFEERSDVFYLSIHRYPFYPGTGAAEEIGRGKGLGYTLNLPMEAKSNDSDYQFIFDEKIIPAIRNYQPDLILISAGFDAHRLDPLGGMNLSSLSFGEMAKKLESLRASLGNIPILYALEGGYSLKGLAESVKAVLEGMG